ncbi:1-phosphofructokinase [Anaerosacchariphilus polymeriproducens]|uniref:Tagatose-6-phosphate kinase n=1 Tax=Anaerosacchariphilus polymeriproducens TaxID=1812858 RepID=A0A371AZZ0_9FIRM|nr:1-phosphofructokinase [Anaerosacchariphilus polymeriproducens]RDU25137.1 1-phosphofructokinase [Anaerosacchariphilus polymeriproducens]
MIYTVTFNPSLDYIVSVENFKVGVINRTKSEQILAGGKGINVSTVLTNLGVQNTALGFIAGFTGAEIERALNAHGCLTDFIKIPEGMSRINIKLRSNEESEINGQGPVIGDSELKQLNEKLSILNEDDILVLAGSIPNTMPDSIYEEILEKLENKKMKVVVDATGDLLVNVLKYHPFLIKPNNHELGEIFGKVLKSNDEIIKYAKELQKMGARNVLISMAGDGAIFVTEDGKTFESPAPKGKLVNSVGAGDSMVAGFLTGYLKEGDYKFAFKMGISAGSASAFSEELATEQEVQNILKSLTF